MEREWTTEKVNDTVERGRREDKRENRKGRGVRMERREGRGEKWSSRVMGEQKKGKQG